MALITARLASRRMDGAATVFEGKGETLADDWGCTEQMPTILGVNGSDHLVDDGGDATQPDGALLDMQNIITLDHDDTHNVNNLVHTGGKLQEGGSPHKTLETSEGDEVQSHGDLLDTTNSVRAGVRLKEMATNGESPTPATNVNECLSPEETEILTVHDLTLECRARHEPSTTWHACTKRRNNGVLTPPRTSRI